jgi:hypothetical protein
MKYEMSETPAESQIWYDDTTYTDMIGIWESSSEEIWIDMLTQYRAREHPTWTVTTNLTTGKWKPKSKEKYTLPNDIDRWKTARSMHAISLYSRKNTYIV